MILLVRLRSPIFLLGRLFDTSVSLELCRSLSLRIDFLAEVKVAEDFILYF